MTPEFREQIDAGLALADQMEQAQRENGATVDLNGRPILLDILVARSNLLLAKAIAERPPW